MSKETHVDFITRKLKEQFESLREGKFEDNYLNKPPSPTHHGLHIHQ